MKASAQAITKKASSRAKAKAKNLAPLSPKHGPIISAKGLAERRKLFTSQLLPNSLAVIVSYPEHTRSNDTEYPYRQSSDVLYLSNFLEPACVLLLTNIKGAPKFTMFVRPKDHTREIWTGKRFGPEGAKTVFDADESFTVDQFSKVIGEHLLKAENVYYKFGHNEHFDALFREEWLKHSHPLHNPESIVHTMRLVKSSEEIAIMRHAANISAEAHNRAMRLCRVGLMEYQIQAEIEKTFIEYGAQAPAYGSIVAGGTNAITLHYVENRAELRNGDLLLIDAACEYQGYASDITRTFPVNGKFTEPQKEIYALVLQAQLAAIHAAKPGATLLKLHEIASNVLRKGLVKLGVLSKAVSTKEAEQAILERVKQGSSKSHVEKNGNRKSVNHAKDPANKGEHHDSKPLLLRDLYMHGTSHWLGLDVHDVGTTGTRSGMGKTIPLEPGMIFTVEPGLYFDPKDKRLPKRYQGIGVRIEDDILITKNGYEVLTSNIPKTIDAIEALMKGK